MLRSHPALLSPQHPLFFIGFLALDASAKALDASAKVLDAYSARLLCYDALQNTLSGFLLMLHR